MNNIYMYNTCFCLALRPPLIAQQYSCSEKTTLFFEHKGTRIFETYKIMI